MKVTIEEVKEIFENCKVPDWEFQGNLYNGGQATVVQVRRKSDFQKGVFRYLKKPEEIDVKRFQREIKILIDSSYKHKNIVNVLAYSLEHPYWYISERGEDFSDYWEQIRGDNIDNPDIIVENGIKVILGLLDGLIPLHNAGIVHRDIKPANIVVVENEPVLIDFTLVYDEKEDRISDENRPAGNRGFSPLQMMYHNEEIPAWFDIYMLSQVLIWMVAERSPKGWYGPLDWRFVRYNKSMKEEYYYSLRALAASCSDPYEGPEDATKMKDLIKNLFSMPSDPKNESNPKINEIVESIKKGKAKSLVVKVTDAGSFESKFPLFEILLNNINNYLKELKDRYKDSLPVTLNRILNKTEWIEKIKKTSKFAKNERVEFCNFRCGENDSAFFQITFLLFYFAPSSKKMMTGWTFNIASPFNPLPDDFLPFTLRLTNHSSSPLYLEKGKNELFFIAMDKVGTLYKFNNSFLIKNSITREELFNIIEKWVTDTESWELIQ